MTATPTATSEPEAEEFLRSELKQARYQFDLIRRALDLTVVGPLLQLAPDIIAIARKENP